jgi:hypothetical protein
MTETASVIYEKSSTEKPCGPKLLYTYVSFYLIPPSLRLRKAPKKTPKYNSEYLLLANCVLTYTQITRHQFPFHARLEARWPMARPPARTEL